MSKSSLIFVSLDGLACSALGPYGCSWLETPGLDRLAGAGAVYDRFIAQSMDRSVVLSRFIRHSGSISAPSLPRLAKDAGFLTLIVTDSGALAQSSLVREFDECHLLEVDSLAPPTMAQSLEETRFGRLIAAALARLEALGDQPYFLWIHSSFLLEHWDAPLELRYQEDLAELLCESSESPPSEAEEFSFEEHLESGIQSLDEAAQGRIRDAQFSTVPPQLDWVGDLEPDVMLAWMTAYGAQVQLLDAVLDTLNAGYLAPRSHSTGLVLASTSGFALGERETLGPDSGEPTGSLLQLPLIMVHPRCSPIRSLRPVGSDSLAATLVDLLGLPETIQDSEPHRSLLEELRPEQWAEPLEEMTPAITTDVAISSRGRVAMTTPKWFYWASRDGEENLYLKPDDRFEVNDVAKLRTDVIAEFRELADS